MNPKRDEPTADDWNAALSILRMWQDDNSPQAVDVLRALIARGIAAERRRVLLRLASQVWSPPVVTDTDEDNDGEGAWDDEEGDNGGWKDGWRGGHAAGREWASVVLRQAAEDGPE